MMNSSEVPQSGSGHSPETLDPPRLKKRVSSWLAVGAALLLTACGASREKEQPSSESLRYLMRSEMSKAFPIDEIRVSPEEKASFEIKIIDFLRERDTEAEIKELEQSRVTLEVSSDERETKKWAGGNEGLSEARAEEIKEIYYNLIGRLRTQQSFNQFSGFFAKKINTRIAISPEHGRGVTSLSQLTNPDTGKPYTPEEISKLSQDELEKLYDQCRYIKILIEKPQPGDRIRQYAELVKILGDFPITRILLDSSGSMDEENRIFADQVAAALAGSQSGLSRGDNKIVSFSETVNWQNYSALKSKADVAGFMEKTQAYGGNEHQFRAVREMLDKLNAEHGASPDRKPSAIVMLSDDGVNDFSMAELQNIIQRSEAANTTVFFALINDESPEKLITMVDAKGLLSEFHEFVARFDQEEYFPRDGMAPEEKEAYLLKSMEVYGAADPEHLGVQVDQNGNIRFRFLWETFQTNINRRYDEVEQKARTLYEQLESKYILEAQGNEKLLHGGKISLEGYEKRNVEIWRSKERELDQLNKKIEAGRARLRALYKEIENK